MQWHKVVSKFLAKNADYVNVFLFYSAMELFNNTSINKYTIELVKGKQHLYNPIYIINPVKLEILKSCIKTHQITKFIQPSKSPTSDFIYFDKKSDSSFCLYINH